MKSRKVTESGLPGVKAIPQGTHMCQFYEGREDLVATLVPFFAAGLRSRERCLWICAEPLPAARAKLELATAGVDVEGAIARGDLSIKDFSDWYVRSGELNAHDVIALWFHEEHRALAAGYTGLRISGNTSFLTPETWQAFMDYEDLVNKAFVGSTIVALCAYPLTGKAPGILDVVRRHHCSLNRPGEGPHPA